MHRRKIAKAMLIFISFVVLHGGVSTAHVTQGVRTEEVVTKSAPQSLGTSLVTAETDIEWRRTYGGFHYEHARVVIQTADGGFALAGSIAPGPGGRPGGEDFLLVKTDARGNMEWNRTYGGSILIYGARYSTYDAAYAVIQTTDGGFALAGGRTRVIEDGSIWKSAWLVKTDASGNPQWNRTYGGTDFAESVIETMDGSFVLAGGWDAWLMKTNARGEVEWKQTYGGQGSYDCVRSVIQTADNGFALAGEMGGFPSCEGNCPVNRFWLAKTDGRGVLQWNRTYVGIGGAAYTVIQVSDGGFALAGGVVFSDGISRGGRLVKTDAHGTVEWGRGYSYYNGSISPQPDSYSYDCIQTADGGFALAGSTASSDAWLVKLPDTTPPAVTLTSPQNTTYTTRRIPVYATNNIEPVHRACWRYWNGSWSVNQPLTWDGSSGRWEAEGLTWRDGSYQVRVFFTDRVGNEGFATQGFTVDTTLPALSSSADIAYEEGMTGYIIAWAIGDCHPGTYDLLSNNSMQVDSAPWTNGTITWNVDGLAPGTYNVTLVVWDAAGNRVSDTVWVTVIAPETPPETLPLPELPLIRTPVLLSLVALVILSLRKKMIPNQ